MITPGLVRMLMLLLPLLNLPHFIQHKPVFTADGHDVARETFPVFLAFSILQRTFTFQPETWLSA